MAPLLKRETVSSGGGVGVGGEGGYCVKRDEEERLLPARVLMVGNDNNVSALQ